jgi:hypothetical protein
LLSIARNIIGGFTHMLGAGVGLAAADVGVVKSAFSQSVFYNNEAFMGISLRERQKHEHLENLFFLPQGTLQSEVVNFNHRNLPECRRRAATVV